ncbi:hypothetical protein NUU61_002726 [Penicillium alfredii]|uniref:Photolyase/cryptochrome alpha/beta domain-containing protein n=1 Tax=Penicillium alfredii TaxID=1506179 RepID=A0A9W9FSA2_9EURO|nr:uncharacterized protein NUU61_002726 [Penicillium alfredii]KAJ5105379.1 hypothetical protein NUU61_002726 [Penicillium alfredii]
MKPSPSNPVVLYWHRTDLRLHDSPALHAALALKPAVFIPVWTWDPHYVYRARVGPNRWKFLLECQSDLSQSYSKLNPKQKLWLVREAPQTVLPKLWKQWQVTHLVFENDTDAYARDRDNEVARLAEDAGVEVIVRMGRNLFDPDHLVRKNGGKPTMSMTQVQKAAEKINNGQPEKPLESPTSIPDPWDEGKMDLSNLQQDMADANLDLNAVHRTTSDKQYSHIMGPQKNFSVPTMEEIGIDPSQAESPHRGGETAALNLLGSHIQNEEYVGTFEKPNTSPAAFEPQSTTLLSPHLHFGSLSVRKFWWDVQSVLEKRKKQKKNNSSIPTNIPGQLLFRDMYFAAQAAIGHRFARTYGNPVIRFIDWHLQSSDPQGNDSENENYHKDSDEAEIWFQRWKEGRTGFPWIDALMRQLRREGWIHHLGRHSVACFLTRGGCYVSWERGAEVFEELLLDREFSFALTVGIHNLTEKPDETACNVGNWMWLSCTAFFSQFYRCYSPVAFGKKWDPEGLFIRHHCPELSQFDKKYIYEPWKAPIADQKKWGCRVTGDGTDSVQHGKVYPKPMFDFDKRRQICLDSMKNAYDVGLHGDDEEVKSGAWKERFGWLDNSENQGKKPSKRQKTD